MKLHPGGGSPTFMENCLKAIGSHRELPGGPCSSTTETHGRSEAL
jgi:hypothetical protein